jgi:septum formation protein
MKLVLASSSPRRRELLAALGLPFEVRPSNCDESVLPGTTAEAAVKELALRKANGVAEVSLDSFVLGSDTVIDLDGMIVGKPADEADAARILRSMRGRVHYVRTAVALVDSRTMRCEVGQAASEVRMREFSDEEIAVYVATGEPLDKAGAYAIQGKGAGLIESVFGDEDTVIGFPMAVVKDLLDRSDVQSQLQD